LLVIFIIMKQDIHPKYYEKARVKCACGHTFEVGSTKENIEVEICGNCHPFYTGKEKLVDTAGRVERFKKIVEKSAAKKETVKEKKPRMKKEKD